MNDDPIAIDLNADAALALLELAGVDSYPPVLALLPTVFDPADHARVRAEVRARLTEIGVLDNGVPHPEVVRWVRCLHRPDVELAARIVDGAPVAEAPSMLRFCLVRSGAAHVLALRCDDHVVIQPVYVDGDRLEAVAAALLAVLGSSSAQDFRPVTASLEEFAAVPADPAERRRALVELGAEPHTAALLTRAITETARRAEIVMMAHRDGAPAAAELCLSVLDTAAGRIVVIPATALDGQIRSTYLPGDDVAVHAGLRALADLLPGHSWFEFSRN
ncbi:ESX secretion-associated protein EspG [Nocardia sp. NPDC003693]